MSRDPFEEPAWEERCMTTLKTAGITTFATVPVGRSVGQSRHICVDKVLDRLGRKALHLLLLFDLVPISASARPFLYFPGRIG